MSERQPAPEDNETFASAGYEGNASLYGEEQWLHYYSTLSTEVLEEKAQRFISMLNDPTTLPKHKAQVARLLDHIVFEVTYRDVTAKSMGSNTTEAAA